MQCEADQSVMIFGSGGDCQEPSAISSTLGRGMSAFALEEAVDKLSEMFPNEAKRTEDLPKSRGVSGPGSDGIAKPFHIYIFIS